MCIFSGPVRSVSNTSIFARREGSKQTLVYSMSVDSNADVAMILPLPVARGTSEIEFVALDECADFFERLQRAFPVYHGRGRSMDLALTKSLEVHVVGNFHASFVPTLADFSRL